MSNGSSPGLVKALLERGTYFKLGAYAGWNTAGNSAGTVVAQTAVIAAMKMAGRGVNVENQVDFLFYSLLQDYVYSSVVRSELMKKTDKPMNIEHPVEIERILKHEVERELGKIVGDYIVGKANRIWGDTGRETVFTSARVRKARLPWGRLFEADFETEIGLAGVQVEAFNA